MSAEILDQEEDLVEVQQNTEETLEQSAPDPLEELSVQDTVEPPEYELPEKYRGKSIQDVVEMHQSAESMIGKQSSEVGELRQFVDGYIKGQLNNDPQAVEEAEEEETDFFEDPQKAINKAIENHPSVIAAERQARTAQTQSAMAQLQEKHSDMAEIAADPAFTKWVQSSKVRQELYERADKNYDTDSADELFSNFKAQRAVAVQTINAERQSRSSQVKAASTGSAQGSANTRVGGKVYRRSDLIKLMVSDPSRYEALSDEILRAYSEGRVK